MVVAVLPMLLALAVDGAPTAPNAYRLPSTQSVANDGGEAIRAYFTDGYGTPAGAVVFVRPAGEEPRVEFHTTGGATLTNVVSLDQWNRVRAAAALFDRRLAPVPRSPIESICLHPWSVLVETAEPARPGIPAVTRNARQSTCDDGLAVPLAYAMADEAVAAMPACALLSTDQHRNAVTRLSACVQLRGDRAAVLARNVFGSDWFDNPAGERTEFTLRQRFGDHARLDWDGTVGEGSEQAARLWSDRLDGATILLRSVTGETADRVRMEGRVVRYCDGRSIELPITMLWTRENGFGFRLRSAKVGGA